MKMKTDNYDGKNEKKENKDNETTFTIPYLFTIAGVNLTEPTGDCWEGYYCVSGVDKPNPLMLNDSQCPEDTVHPIIGHACPPGTYCVTGSDYPEG